jgi:5-methylcytosine-specific restriction endonuclease McrA
MDLPLKDLNNLEQSFIDTVCIQCKTYAEAEKILDVDRAKIRQLNKDLEPYWRPITKIRDKWKLKKIGGNFWDFYKWYKSTEQHCHYCKITQAQIDKLHILGLNNKRTTRGRTLEIDRKIADESYSNITNLVYSCYWCNNAKTDTFTEEEFKIIGLAIGTIWKQRLNI